MLHLKDCC